MLQTLKSAYHGGTGADHFVYRTARDSSGGNFTPFLVDVIADFSSAEGDRVDLSLVPGSDGFVFNGTADFSGRGNGEIRFADGLVFVDVDGNASADLTIQMIGVTTVSNTDQRFGLTTTRPLTPPSRIDFPRAGISASPCSEIIVSSLSIGRSVTMRFHASTRSP